MVRSVGLVAVFALMAGFVLARSEAPSRSGQVPISAADVVAASAFYDEAPRGWSLRQLVRATPAIDDDDLTGEQKCLAQAIYFEARSETLEGQLAVAQVVLNRAEDRRYPSNICRVVFQNERLRHRCQFSFACDGRSDTPFERRAWETAKRISRIAIEGGWYDLSGAATHYHATYARPGWREAMLKTATHGRHVFYRDAS